MVRGIDTFKEFFKGFEGNYVIIGGTACEIHEDLYAQVPRATKEDVFRLAAMLTPASRYELPDILKTDVCDFCDAIMQDLPNADFIKSAGLGNVTSLQIIEQLKKSML